MGFNITLKTDSPYTRARLTQSRPIMFRFEVNNGKDGVLALVQHNTTRQAYFYPRAAIEDAVGKLGGRENYVYREGFDIGAISRTLASTIKDELPQWDPQLNGPMGFELHKLIVSQPGIDMWRILCFALDHSAGYARSATVENFINEQTPPIFSAWSVQNGPVIYAGNHRALFALASGLPEINMSWVHVPSRAFRFVSAQKFNVDHVESAFGSRGLPALVKSFIGQVEATR
jgi:hypothetical protein